MRTISSLVVPALLLRPSQSVQLSLADPPEEMPDDEFKLRLMPGDPMSHERSSAGMCSDGRVDPLRRCPGCSLGAAGKQQLFIKESRDGAGSRIQEIIGAMAYAERHNITFAGIVSSGCAESHGVEIFPVVQEFFGIKEPADLYFRAAPDGAMTHTDWERLKTQDAARAEAANVIYSPNFPGARDWVGSQGISPTLHAALREAQTPLRHRKLLLFANHGQKHDFSVAVHVRRGDVFATQWYTSLGRGTRDEWYLQLLDTLRDIVPQAKFHIFSSTENKHSEKEFDVYREWGAEVHLDTELRDTMAHMARADVLVTAKSAFSFNAGVLQNNCLLHSHWGGKIPGMVLLPGTKCGAGHDTCDWKFNSTRREEIAACVGKAKAAYDRNQ